MSIQCQTLTTQTTVFCTHIYIGCPTTYQTRQFFNYSKTNEDIATRFEQEYVHCVRNEKECVCTKIIKELPGLVGSGTPCTTRKARIRHTSWHEQRKRYTQFVVSCFHDDIPWTMTKLSQIPLNITILTSRIRTFTGQDP